MRTLLLALAALTVASWLHTGVAWAQPNLLANGGFDSDLSGWELAPGDGRASEWVTDDVFDSSLSGSLQATNTYPASGGQLIVQRQCVPIDGPGLFRVSGWAFNPTDQPTPGNAAILLRPARNADCTGDYGTGTGATSSSAGVWRYLEADLAVTHATVPHQAVEVALAVSKVDAAQPRTARFDRITLVSLDDPPPLVNIFVMRSGDGVGTVMSHPAGILFPPTGVAGFPQGTMLALVAMPDAGYAFERWDGPCTHGDPVCEFEVTQSTTATAIFRTQQNLQLQFIGIGGGGRVTSDPAGADCIESCVARFVTGTTVILTATPDTGSRFVRWDTSVPADCSGTLPTCTLTMTQQRTARPVFQAEGPVMHTLDVFLAGDGAGTVTSAPAGISCTPACGAEFADGTVVTLTAAPAAGSHFTGWSQDCAGTSTTCELTMDVARSAMAFFEADAPPPRMLQVSLEGTGLGTVVSAPAGIDCPGACSAKFPGGSSVLLTAMANAGSRFDGWSGACSGNLATCEVAMAQDQDEVATFNLVAASTHALSVDVTGDGRVTSVPTGVDCPGTCVAAFASGAAVSLHTAAAPGWRFAGWSGHCGGEGGCTVTMNDGRAVGATFVEDVAHVYGDGFESRF